MGLHLARMAVETSLHEKHDPPEYGGLPSQNQESEVILMIMRILGIEEKGRSQEQKDAWRYHLMWNQVGDKVQQGQKYALSTEGLELGSLPLYSHPRYDALLEGTEILHMTMHYQEYVEKIDQGVSEQKGTWGSGYETS